MVSKVTKRLIICLPQRVTKWREGIEMNAFPRGGRGTTFGGG